MLARTANIDRSLIGRWLNEGTVPSIDSIRAVSRAFRRDIREGLVATGLFTEEEMHFQTPTAPDLRMLGDDELLGEVRRRLAARRAQPAPQGGGSRDGDVFETEEESGDQGTETPEDGEPGEKPASRGTQGRRRP